jgi:hypothetical protein
MRSISVATFDLGKVRNIDNSKRVEKGKYMTPLDEKIDIAFQAAVFIGAGIAGCAFTAFKAHECFTWGNDAAWGYVLMNVGTSMIVGMGIRRAMDFYKLLRKS